MSALENLKAELAALRDEAKVQAHLGSMEAQQEWQESEAKWNQFVAEAGLHEAGQDIKSALEYWPTKTSCVLRAAQEGVLSGRGIIQ